MTLSFLLTSSLVWGLEKREPAYVMFYSFYFILFLFPHTSLRVLCILAPIETFFIAESFPVI